MGYIADVSNVLDGYGCGESCRCGPCRAGTRLSEWYVKPEEGDEDEDEAEGERKGNTMAGVHPFEPLWPVPVAFRTPRRR